MTDFSACSLLQLLAQSWTLATVMIWITPGGSSGVVWMFYVKHLTSCFSQLIMRVMSIYLLNTLQNHISQHPWPPNSLGSRVRTGVSPPERHPWPAQRGVLPRDTPRRLLCARLALPEWQDDQTLSQYMRSTEEGLHSCLRRHRNGLALLSGLRPLLRQRTGGVLWPTGRAERYSSHCCTALC